MTNPSAAPAAKLAFATLLLVAILAPLGFARPGLPGAFKGDEPGYYLLASSLWNDRDARVDEEGDLRRLFEEFPERTHNLWLVSPDDFETVYFGVPFLYPLLAAPAVGLFGARGMIALNGVLFVAALWMGWAYLRRFNSDATAGLYAGAFFALSPVFVYVFWLQSEVLNVACLTGAFFLLLRKDDAEPAGAWSLAGSGALLACVVYSRPTAALLALPLVWVTARRRRLKGAAIWCTGAVVATIALGAVSFALVEEAWVYGGLSRKPFDISSPVGFLERMAPAAATYETKAEAWSGSHLKEIFLPWRAEWRRFPREALYFFVGRHLGLLVYMPLAALSILLFLWAKRRAAWRYALLVCALAAGLLWVLYLPANWRGGGPAFGNRIFCSVYPSFLFLVTAIRPGWSVPLGAGLAALFLGGGLLTAIEPPGGDPTAQRHTLGVPFRSLPREIELSGITGYVHAFHSGASFSAHQDLMAPVGDELWLRGGTAVELWMITAAPIRDAVFRIRALAPGNQLRICLEDACESLETGPQPPPEGERFQVTLPAGTPRRLRRVGGAEYLYGLTVRSTSGEQPRWRSGGSVRFYLGAALTYLGASDEAERPMYAARWRDVVAPPSLVAGEETTIAATLHNESSEAWVVVGATRVTASYHWLDEAGERVVWDGLRTPLASEVPPGGEISVALRVRAPLAPGRYQLVLDLVRENLVWFSIRDPEAAWRTVVPVEAPASDG